MFCFKMEQLRVSFCRAHAKYENGASKCFGTNCRKEVRLLFKKIYVQLLYCLLLFTSSSLISADFFFFSISLLGDYKVDSETVMALKSNFTFSEKILKS